MSFEFKLPPIETIPAMVLWIKTSNPVGVNTYEKTLAEYPEWFPEEIEFNKRWGSIPNDIKDKYFTSFKIQKDIDAPPYNGISSPPDMFANYMKYLDSDVYKNKQKEKELKRVKLYNELFNSYGISRDLKGTYLL